MIASPSPAAAQSEMGVQINVTLSSAQHGGQIAVRELRTLDTRTFWAPNQVPLPDIQAHYTIAVHDFSTERLARYELQGAQFDSTLKATFQQLNEGSLIYVEDINCIMNGGHEIALPPMKIRVVD